MVDAKILGHKIKHMRIQRDFSIKEFSASTGISVPHIRNIENGYRLPSMSNFIVICNILNVRPHILLYPYLYQSWSKEKIKDEINDMDAINLSLLIDLINAIPGIST